MKLNGYSLVSTHWRILFTRNSHYIPQLLVCCSIHWLQAMTLLGVFTHLLFIFMIFLLTTDYKLQIRSRLHAHAHPEVGGDGQVHPGPVQPPLRHHPRDDPPLLPEPPARARRRAHVSLHTGHRPAAVSDTTNRDTGTLSDAFRHCQVVSGAARFCQILSGAVSCCMIHSVCCMIKSDAVISC